MKISKNTFCLSLQNPISLFQKSTFSRSGHFFSVNKLSIVILKNLKVSYAILSVSEKEPAGMSNESWQTAYILKCSSN